jgi:putative NADPH-quinone reductase
MKNILIIDGNPARERNTLDAALAKSYEDGAKAVGHKVKSISLATLIFDPILHEGYTKDQPLEPDLQMLRDAMVEAEHWVLVFPLWLGLPPALVKGFLERTITRGFAFEYSGKYPVALPILKGKSIHIIITCGMPRFIYRWLSGQPTSKALRTLFKLCGMKVTSVTIYGLVNDHSPKSSKRYNRYIDAVRQLGNDAK